MRKLILFIPTPPPVHGVSVMLKIFTDYCYGAGLPTVICRTNTLRRAASKKNLKKSLILIIRLLMTAIQYSRKYNEDMFCICVATKGGALYRDVALSIIFKAAGVDLTIYVHGIELAESGSLKKWLLIRSWRGARYIFVSEEVEKMHMWLVNDSRTYVVHNGAADLGWLSSGGVKRKIKLLFFSNVFKEKGIEDFTSVLNRLTVKGVEFEAKIVGSLGVDYPIEKLNILTKGLVEKGVVSVCGPLYEKEEKKRVFHWADVLLFTSKRESFGNVLIEAMSTGLPAISGPTTSANFILENGEAGFLVCNYVPEAIEIIENYRNYDIDKIRRAARNRFDGNFTEDKYVENLKNVFWPS